MINKHLIYIPGKNPKPAAAQHRSLLWSVLLEGIRRVDPVAANGLILNPECLKLIDWNYLYYDESVVTSRDIFWIDDLIKKEKPTEQDMQQANSWHKKLDRYLYNIADTFPILIRILPRHVRMTALETRRYFKNESKIAYQIRELLKKELRPLLSDNNKILVIGHSLGSVIAYDTLYELSRCEKHAGKIDLLLTIGSPLGMRYVQRRLMGNNQSGQLKYPTNIRKWINISSVGDLTALDEKISDDYNEMLNLKLINSIEDYSEGIYNFFRDDHGLNCHRSYGYLINSTVAKVIAQWWNNVD